MKSNQYSHHHVHLQTSPSRTFICTGMNVYNHSAFFKRYGLCVALITSLLPDGQCLPITHMSLEETEL